MAVTRQAVVRNADGRVQNVIEHDDANDWTPPTGHMIVADPTGAAVIGGIWDGAAFQPPGPTAFVDRLTAKQRAAVDRLAAFVGHAPGTSGEQADQFLGLTGNATLAQLTAVAKALIRNDRAIATVLHMIVTEMAEED